MGRQIATQSPIKEDWRVLPTLPAPLLTLPRKKGFSMTNLAQPTAVVNTVTPSPEFVVSFGESHISECLSPLMMGAHDAERDALCLPEIYYTRLGEQRKYAEGHESVAGRTLLSDQIMGRVELEELTEDMLDREYHAHGGW
jgi:hypothetical protein